MCGTCQDGDFANANRARRATCHTWVPRQTSQSSAGRQLMIPKLLQNLPYLLTSTHECLHTSRVEVLTLLRFEVGECLFEAPRMFVWPRADQGVEYIRHCDDPRHDRNVFAMQTIGITGSVVLFMMAERDDRAHA